MRRAQESILPAMSGGGMVVSGGIEAIRFSMSIAEVRKRYTAVNVELAKSAAAFSCVMFSSSVLYLTRALFMRAAANAFILLLSSLRS